MLIWEINPLVSLGLMRVIFKDENVFECLCSFGKCSSFIALKFWRNIVNLIDVQNSMQRYKIHEESQIFLKF